MQKRIFYVASIVLAFATQAFAQFVPQGFNYQSVVRDASGKALANQSVTLIFAIRSGAPNGPTVYAEKRSVNTNDFGLVNLTVGSGGSVLEGSFEAINWGGGAKFLSVSIETSANVFDELGAAQLMSVPYALYAQTTANGGSGGGDNWGSQSVQTDNKSLSGNGTSGNPLSLAPQNAQAGQVLKWNGSAWTPQDDIVASGINGGTVTQINTGSGLTGGPITTNGTIQLAPTGVIPGSYGSSSQHPIITVDGQGRITNVYTVVSSPGTIGLAGGDGIEVKQSGINFTVINTGDTNGGDDVTVNSNANGDVSGVFSNLQIKPDAVGAAELANGAVTTPKIANGAITAAKLGDMGASNGQVLKWNGASWAPQNDQTGSISLSEGPGINVSGGNGVFTIINTGDLDPGNDLTTGSAADGDVSGIFSNLQIKPDAVTINEMADNSVGTNQIITGAVTGAKIANMGASNGQVLKWNGATWAPQNDQSGSVSLSEGAGINISGGNGVFTIVNTGDIDPGNDLTNNSTADGDVSGVFSNLQIKPDAVTINEMADNSVGTSQIITGAVTGAKIANMGASSGQVLKWNGSSWAPQNDQTGSVSLIEGAGINIAANGNAFTIVNSGDTDPSNDITTTSTANGDVSGVFSNLQIKAGAVQTAELADGAVTAAKLAKMDAATGQVLKWNGIAWAPGPDNTGSGGSGGDNWGSQAAATGPTITGNGTAGSPLNIAQQGASNGQVLKWNGVSWAPGADNTNSGGGDNWGSQAAVAGPTLTGNGTAGSPLNIAQQGANNGQVLKWNGATWGPANDTGNDNWGNQTVQTSAVLSGNGTAGAPLTLAQQNAGNGQVLKWNGISWAPDDDNNTGDNWGGQAVQTSNVLSGNGTGINPLTLAQQNASNGQVLKWNGASWTPANDTGNDNWGSQTVQTGTALSGAGTAGNPLNLAQQGATAGQVLKWNGSAWAPGVDNTGGSGGGTYAAGTGISITGSAPNQVINNTGDLSDNNEIQALALSNNVLSLSKGGGSVNLPVSNTYAAGNGINISGVAPNLTLTNTGDLSNTNELQTLSLNNGALTLSNGGGSVVLPTANTYTAGAGISITGTAPNQTINNTGDVSSTNEIQTLSLSGTTLELSKNGGSVDFQSILNSAPNQTWTKLGNDILNANSGTVGIGPAAVLGDKVAKLQVRSGNASERAAHFEIVNPGNGRATLYATTFGTGPAGYFNSESGQIALVTGSGRVGIATGSPDYQLDVNGPTRIYRESPSPQLYIQQGDNDASRILFSNFGSNGRWILGAKSGGAGANVSFDYSEGGTKFKPFTLNGDGSVSLGDSTNKKGAVKIYHEKDGLSLVNVNSGKNWEFWVNDVNGNLNLYNSTSGNTPAGVFAVNGVYTSSDRRLKRDILHIPDVLDRLLSLDAVSFRFLQDAETDAPSLGFIAQDVRDRFPELVMTGPVRNGGGGTLMVNYAGFSVIAVKAIQEQSKQINTLKQENSDLRTRLDAIEARLRQIEQK